MMKLKRYGNGEPVEYRTPANIDEMDEWCTKHRRIEFVSNKGDAREAKVNGKVKRWKRDPGRIAVPLKYGMYECTTFYEYDINRILIPVERDT